MSARMLSSLAEENKDLQKQIGCMNGLFQLFDRHHFLTNRRLHTQNHKRLLLGATNRIEPGCTIQLPMEKTPSEVIRNKVLPSEPNKRAQQEPPSCSRSYMPGPPSKILPFKQPSSGQQSPDFRDVVKDSMHREARSLSVKTVNKVEGRVHVMKHIDSPRPCGKPSEGTRQQVTAKFREALKDHPRFSYDERDSRQAMRSSMRIKDLPRLSLDSREQSFRSSASESRSNFLLGDHRRENDISQLQGHRRSSSVIAKLMGLEALPDSIPSNKTETLQPKSFPANGSVFISTNTTEKSKKNQGSQSPQLKEKDFGSPRPTRAASVSRLPLEPAPWKQLEAGRTSHKSTPRNKDTEVPIKTQQIPSSVYGEIEKRITALEFRKSGKDLRALKQILEAMQKTRAKLEGQREEQAQPDENMEIVQTRHQSCPPSPTMMGTRQSKREDTIAKKTSKDVTPPRVKNVRDSGWSLPSPDRKIKGGTTRAVQNPILRQQKEETYPAQGRRSYGSESPRAQQKKQPSAINTSPEFRRQSIKQPKESGTLKRRPQSKSRNLPRVDEELSELSSSTRNFSDAASVQSESNNSLSSHAEGEVTSRNLSFEVNAKRLDDGKDKAELSISTIEQPSPVSVLDSSFYEEDSPSPVKKKTTVFRDGELWCLDYPDHSPYSTRMDSSANKKLEHIKDMARQLGLLDSDHETNVNQLDCSIQNHHKPNHRYITKILLASGLLKDVDSFLMAIQLYSSSQLIDPRLFYILEQTEECVTLENEHNQKSGWTEFNQKIQRKNIFDTVNEILVRKLASESCLMHRKNPLTGQQLLKELKSDMDNLNAKKVGADSEDDELISILNADMRETSEDWIICHGEIPSLVLDVERLIFKDLITEIVLDEAREQLIRSRRHCRQLFTK